MSPSAHIADGGAAADNRVGGVGPGTGYWKSRMIDAIAAISVDKASLRDRTKGRTIQQYDATTIVQDPNLNTRNNEQRNAALKDAREVAVAHTSIDLDALNDLLLQRADSPDRRFDRSAPAQTSHESPRHSPSPYEADPSDAIHPVMDAAELQFMRDEELEHRQMLMDGGCPPCLPPNSGYDYPYDTPEREPLEHPAAMFYLKGSISNHDRPLCAQLLDWEAFRRRQVFLRKHFQDARDPDDALQEYVNDSRKAMLEHTWTASTALVDFALDVATQSRLQNWLEFMAVHLAKDVALRRSAERRVRDATNEDDRSWHKGYDAHRIVLHGEMLSWMEAQRVAISASVETETKPETDTDDHAAAVVAAVAGHRRSGRVQGHPSDRFSKTSNPAKAPKTSEDSSSAEHPVPKLLKITRDTTTVYKRPPLDTSLNPRPTQPKGRPRRTATLPTPECGPEQPEQPEQQPRPMSKWPARATIVPNSQGKFQTKAKTNTDTKASSTKTRRTAKKTAQPKQQPKQSLKKAATAPVSTRSGRHVQAPERLGFD